MTTGNDDTLPVTSETPPAPADDGVGVSSGPIHPALHFEPGFASVGIMGRMGVLEIISRDSRSSPLPTRTTPSKSGRGFAVKGRPLHPEPADYPDLYGRWPAGDVASFCRDGGAPPFSTFLVAIREELGRYIEFALPETPSLVACWIAGTYFHPLFTTFPRLNITGPKRTGKSKILQLVASLSFNGLYLTAPTVATMFRLIDPLKPTLCLDEMEQLDGKDVHPIGIIINQGYKDGASVPRTEDIQGKRKVVSYAAYAPMALASITGMRDVLADRAVSVQTQRGLDRPLVNSEVQPRDPSHAQIRDMGYRLALTGPSLIGNALTVVREQQDGFKTLSGRPLELYRPLIAVALIAAGDDDSFLRDLQTLVAADSEDRESLSPDAVRVFTALEGLLIEAESVTVSPSGLATLIGDDWISAESAGKMLRQYGFPKLPRSSRSARYTVTRAHFTEQAKRYDYPFSGFEQPSSQCEHKESVG